MCDSLIQTYTHLLTKSKPTCEAWCSATEIYENSCHLGCDTVQFGTSIPERMN